MKTEVLFPRAMVIKILDLNRMTERMWVVLLCKRRWRLGRGRRCIYCGKANGYYCDFNAARA